MAKQIFYEDVQVGSDVTTLQKIATTRMLVQYAGASGDFNPLHYEEDFAKNLGVGRPIVHGLLKRAWLVNLMTDWMGQDGTLKKLSCRYRGMDYPRKMKTFDDPVDGDTWLCKGKVTGKNDADHTVECEIWVENSEGKKNTTGATTVLLPSKAK